MDSITLQLHDCIISRRGKAAKGSVPVKTFGIPNPPRKNRKGEFAHDPLVTKTFDYDKLVEAYIEKPLFEFFDLIEQLSGFNKRLMMKSALVGADKVLMSKAIQAQSSIAQIANILIAAELVCDEDEAKSVAKDFNLWRTMCEKRLKPIPTIDDLLDERRIIVAGLKEKGLWNPKLVVEKLDETADDDSDEDNAEESV